MAKAKAKTKVKAKVNAAKTASRKLPDMPIVAVPWNGPYEAKRTGTDELIARGSFKNGKREGTWTFLYDGEMTECEYIAGKQNHTRPETPVLDGLVTTQWPNGTLKTSCTYVCGARHGEELEYAEDGTQTFKGSWKYGFEIGEHIYEDTTIEWVDGLPASVAEDDKALARTRKLYEKAATWTAVHDGLQTCKAETRYATTEAWFLQLWRKHRIDISASEAHEMLVKVAVLISGDELVDMLGTMKLDETDGWPITGWTEHLDQLAMSVYARDPAPLDAATLKGPARLGIALVRARHGKDVGNVLTKHRTTSSLWRFWWPDNVLGPREIDPETNPPEVASLRALFGTDEEWGRDLKKALASDAEDNDVATDAATHRIWIATAKPEELAKLVGKLSRADWSALIEWRHDDAAALTTIATAMSPGTAASQLAAFATVAHHTEGSSPPDALLELLSLRHQWPNFAYSERLSIDSLQDEHGITHRALQTLPPARSTPVIERALVESTEASAYLYLVDDLELIDATISRILKESYPVGLMTGIGEGGARVLDLLIGRLAKPGSAKAKRGLQAAIVVALARMVVDDGAFDPQYDAYVDFGTLSDSYMRGFLERILRKLPRERAEAILIAGLEADLVEAFPFIQLCATEPVLRTAFTNILTAKKVPRELGETIDWLPDSINWWQWLVDAGVTGALADEAQRQLGLGEYAET